MSTERGMLQRPNHPATGATSSMLTDEMMTHPASDTESSMGSSGVWSIQSQSRTGTPIVNPSMLIASHRHPYHYRNAQSSTDGVDQHHSHASQASSIVQGSVDTGRVEHFFPQVRQHAISQEGLEEFVNDPFYTESEPQESSHMTAPIYNFRPSENADVRGRAMHQASNWTELEERAFRENFHAAESQKWKMIAASMAGEGYPARTVKEYRDHLHEQKDKRRRPEAHVRGPG